MGEAIPDPPIQRSIDYPPLRHRKTMNSTQSGVLGFLLSAACIIPGPAISKPFNAKCLLLIDGTTRMNSKCSFVSDSDSDFFSDEKLLVVCPDGRSVEHSSCYGYEQRVAAQGVFGYLFRRGSSGDLCWNEGTMRKASPCFDGLRRSGACWESASAKNRHLASWHQVKFCAREL
jgi:hypothetical protein